MKLSALHSLLPLLLLPLIAMSAESDIHLPRTVPYLDESIIQDNVVRECRNLGSDLSGHIAKALQAHGITATKQDELDISKGTVLDVKIVSLTSSGNAFVGHHKSVTVSVKTYKDGQASGSKTFIRDTGGGVFGEFKGSCSVLDRATTAIGKDIAKWYKAQ